MAAFSTVAAAVGLAFTAASFVEQRNEAENAQTQANIIAMQQERQAEEVKVHQQAQAAAIQDQSFAQKQQFELQRKQADISNARSVRAAVRTARIARAAVLNQGANTGTLGSSGVQGGASSVGSQLNSNISFFNQMGDLNNQMIDSQIAQSNAATEAGLAAGRAQAANRGVSQAGLIGAQADMAAAGALGNLGGTIFNAAGGFKTIFDAAKK